MLPTSAYEVQRLTQTQTKSPEQPSIQLQFDCLEETSDLENSQLEVRSVTPSYKTYWRNPIEKHESPIRYSGGLQNTLGNKLLEQIDSDEFVWQNSSQILGKSTKISERNRKTHEVSSKSDGTELCLNPTKVHYPYGDPLPLRGQLPRRNASNFATKRREISKRRNANALAVFFVGGLVLMLPVGANYKHQGTKIDTLKTAYTTSLQAPTATDARIFPSDLTHSFYSRRVAIQTGLHEVVNPDFDWRIDKQTEQSGRFKRPNRFGYFGGLFGLDARSTTVAYYKEGDELPAISGEVFQKFPKPNRLLHQVLVQPAPKIVHIQDREPPVLQSTRFAQTLIPEIALPDTRDSVISGNKVKMSLSELKNLFKTDGQIVSKKPDINNRVQPTKAADPERTKSKHSELKDYFRHRAGAGGPLWN